MKESREPQAVVIKEKFVPEKDLLETLNRCLWEIERRKAVEDIEPPISHRARR